MGPKTKKSKQAKKSERSRTETIVSKTPRSESTTENPKKKTTQVLSVSSAKGRISANTKRSKVPTSDHTRTSSDTSSSSASEMSLDQDILVMTLPENTQKIVHCRIGEDLFVDKTWCTVKKSDILEDISIQDEDSPFFKIIHKIRAYTAEDVLIGYEPFEREEDQFYVCITEAGRDEVLNKLQNMRNAYLRKIQMSKAIQARPWVSHGSEESVDLFKVKNTRPLISLEWIGEIAKRCLEPEFNDCDPESMKNGYTCLLPGKDQPELVFMKTQDIGTQAVPVIADLGVQTDPEIPTNASTQCDPEGEIAESQKSKEIVQPQDLNAFFDKYLNYLTDVLHYNEVYDLYHDDYPALVGESDDSQIHHYSTYRQYQSFTDVAAIEGKLVISSSWHPNYTGVVAIAYANEIPCKMQELEYDSDQVDYEEEKTDESEGDKPDGESGDETQGAKEWLDEEKFVREAKEENTEAFDMAMNTLKDINTEKLIWESKIMEEVEEVRMRTSEIDESDHPKYEYIEYQEPVLEPEIEPEVEEKPDQTGIPDEGLTTEDIPTDGVEHEKDLDAEDIVLDQSLPIETEPDGELISQNRSYSQSIVTERSEISDGFVIKHDKTTPKSSKHRIRRSSGIIHSQRNKLGISRRGSVRDESSLSVTYSSHTSTTTMSQLTGISSVSDISTSRASYLEQEQFEEVTDDEEIKEEEEELPFLEPNNPVLIWSFVDDLVPKLRLDSPYEVTCIQFCPHNGNYIAGGTVSGQIVVWDITGRIESLEKPEPLTPQQQKYRKILEYLMEWRRDIRSKRRVRACAISRYEDSHSEKIKSLNWVLPFVRVNRLGEIETIPPPMSLSLQICTVGNDGIIKTWDLETNPFTKGRKQVHRYKTKGRFGRPESLDAEISPFSKLYMNWKPVVTLKVSHNHLPVMLTGLAKVNSRFTRVRVQPPDPTVKETLEDRVEYRVVHSAMEGIQIPNEFVCSTEFGYPGNCKWEPLDDNFLVGTDGTINCSAEWWKCFHDGPITRISRHPFFKDICLTIGGHVFAIWHSEDKEYPIMSKRYYGIHITDGFWSDLRPSLIRIARSDGVVEIWDLLTQSHAPANQIVVSGKIITNMSAPILPEAHGLLGIADYNSAFRLFYIPRQFRVWTQNELERVNMFLNREPKRKIAMREWSKWWQENNVNFDREEKRKAEEKKKYEDEERLEKEKLEEARQKYNEEVYKWYIRRRGKPFLRQEEEDQKWKYKQEQHMHEVIMQKKKVDRAEMEVLMRPLVKERENKAQKLVKAKEKIKQADAIFRSTVDLIFPKKTKVKPVLESEDQAMMEEVYKKMDQYFGDGFKDIAAEQLELIERSPWQFDFEFSELMDKYNSLRMLFNDRRRKRNKTLRWLRKKLKEELLSEGLKIHVRKSHKDRYRQKKIKRRELNLELLKNMYGEDYNVHWDRIHPCRRFADRKFKAAIDDSSNDFYEIEAGSVSEEFSLESVTESLGTGRTRLKSTLEVITDIARRRISQVELDIDTSVLLSQSLFGENFEKSQTSKAMSDYESKARSLGIAYKPSTVSSDVTGIKTPSISLYSPVGVSFVSLPKQESEIDQNDSEMNELEYITQKVSESEASTVVFDTSSDIKKDSKLSQEAEMGRELQVFPITQESKGEIVEKEKLSEEILKDIKQDDKTSDVKKDLHSKGSELSQETEIEKEIQVLPLRQESEHEIVEKEKLSEEVLEDIVQDDKTSDEPV